MKYEHIYFSIVRSLRARLQHHLRPPIRAPTSFIISLPNRDSFECPGSKRGSRSPLVRPLRLSMEREGIGSFQNTGTSADKSVMMGI